MNKLEQSGMRPKLLAKHSTGKHAVGEAIKLAGPALVIIFLAFWFTYQFVDPAPPRQIAIATGTPDGAYYAHGEIYRQILSFNGLSENDTVIIAKGGQEAAGMLQQGGIDAAVFVMALEVPVIQQLLSSDGIFLMSMKRAEAYVVHYLSKLKMPEGAIDLVRNVPSSDISLLAVTSQLVIRTDME